MVIDGQDMEIGSHVMISPKSQKVLITDYFKIMYL